MQMYLKADLSKEGLAERISILRQVMVRGGMTLDRKGYSLLLEASVQLEDPKVRSVLRSGVTIFIRA